MVSAAVAFRAVRSAVTAAAAGSRAEDFPVAAARSAAAVPAEAFNERGEFSATLPRGNAVRKNQRFLTALLTLAVPKENNRSEREFSLTAAP